MGSKFKLSSYAIPNTATTYKKSIIWNILPKHKFDNDASLFRRSERISLMENNFKLRSFTIFQQGATDTK